MRYIVFWEFCPEDMDKVVEKYVKLQKEREKNPEKFVKYLFPSHSIGGQTKGISVAEGTQEQIVTGVLYWHPEVKIKCMPIFEFAKIVEQYLKSK